MASTTEGKLDKENMQSPTKTLNSKCRTEVNKGDLGGQTGRETVHWTVGEGLGVSGVAGKRV